MKTFIISVVFAVKNLLCNCHQDNFNHQSSKESRKIKVSKAGKLDVKIRECSGLTPATVPGEFYAISDGGNPPVVYRIKSSGELLETLMVPDAVNNDWEEITSSSQGTLYIGDFGNNANTRQDLRIYVYSPSTHKTDSILFFYPDQHHFPPTKKERNFDCEAFFWYQHNLYLLSKNRGVKQVHIYTVPDKPGIYQAKLLQSIVINGAITGAAFEAGTGEGYLSSYGRIYYFRINKAGLTFLSIINCRKFGRSGQAEAVAIVDSSTAIIANENRKVFRIKHKTHAVKNSR